MDLPKVVLQRVVHRRLQKEKVQGRVPGRIQARKDFVPQSCPKKLVNNRQRMKRVNQITNLKVKLGQKLEKRNLD